MSKQNQPGCLTIGLVSFAVVFVLCTGICMLPAIFPHTDKPSGNRSALVTLQTDDHGDFLGATSAAAYERMTDLSVAGDQIGVRQMVALGQAVIIQSGTEAKLITPGFLYTEVRITEGEHAGKAVFVAAEYVKGK